MTFLDHVSARQSCRAYRPTPVSRAAIERCCEAARLAPSACNSQPWSFIVVDDPAHHARVAAAAFSGVYSTFAFAAQAPVLIVVETLRSTYAAALGGLWRGVSYNLIDLGIACEHFVLQATEEGLGTCWIGWFNARGVKKALGLPRRTRLDILISMGYPADTTIRVKQRKSLDTLRRYAGDVSTTTAGSVASP